jgi:hypothetical protein
MICLQMMMRIMLVSIMIMVMVSGILSVWKGYTRVDGTRRYGKQFELRTVRPQGQTVREDNFGVQRMPPAFW